MLEKEKVYVGKLNMILVQVYLAGYDVEGRRKKSQEVITIRAVGM